MNLVVDCGNTRVKYGVFENNQIIEFGLITNDFNAIFLKFKSINKVIIASVTQQHTVIQALIPKGISVVLFSNNLKLPLQNLYQSAQTLGSDRLAASIGSFTLFPNINVLTIDAGTCIKYNFVNNKNQYIGGAISPGLNMRLKALNHYTHSLPLISFDENYDNLTGTNTQNSILSGTQIAAVCEVESMIERYLALYPDLKIVFTGGDANYLCKQLKNRFFADEHLILKGLNATLNYQ
ncbi:MAG: type III pantothenate kinase [Bacteroidia bacterium]